MSQAYQPLHHKYRPQSFKALVGQEAIAATLNQALKTNRIAPAYLFSGPRGTGKTSSARILAKSLNCLKEPGPTPEPCGECELCEAISEGIAMDIIEIDAASNTGVENIRDLIERSKFAPVQARWKVYVIDECHMLSTAAFNALLKTLEEPPAKVVFILATTDPQRVLPTILSRCQRFDFRQIPINALTKHLEMIALKESILIENEALKLIAQRSEGGLRDAESLLDQLSLLPGKIKIETIWELLGAVPEKELLSVISALSEEDPLKLIESCRSLINKGRDPGSILQGITSILRDLVIVKLAPDKRDLCGVSNQFFEVLQKLSERINLEVLINWQAELKGAENQLRLSVRPSLWIEVLLLGLLAKPVTYNPNTSKHNIELNEKDQLNNRNKVKDDKTFKDIKVTSEMQEANTEEHLETNELWSQILGLLELPSTRMLLTQQARLISISNKKVKVQVANKWMGMVESRTSLLKEAVEKALGGPRELILESQEISQFLSEKQAISKNEKVPTIRANSQIKSKKPEDIKIDLPVEGKNKADRQAERPANQIDNQAKKLANFFNGQVLEDNP